MDPTTNLFEKLVEFGDELKAGRTDEGQERAVKVLRDLVGKAYPGFFSDLRLLAKRRTEEKGGRQLFSDQVLPTVGESGLKMVLSDTAITVLGRSMEIPPDDVPRFVAFYGEEFWGRTVGLVEQHRIANQGKLRICPAGCKCSYVSFDEAVRRRMAKYGRNSPSTVPNNPGS